jgi:hypothetical protein
VYIIARILLVYVASAWSSVRHWMIDIFVIGTPRNCEELDVSLRRLQRTRVVSVCVIGGRLGCIIV